MKRIRKTKIVATVAPALIDNGVLEKLLAAEVDVVRLNFSHGEYSEFTRLVRAVNKYRERHAPALAILQDLAGPEVRIGGFSTPEVELKVGQDFVITNDPNLIGDENKVGVNHRSLPTEVEKGDTIILDDGRILLTVTAKKKDRLTCRVKRGGKIKKGRGLAVPGRHLSLPALTDRDKNDVKFGLEKEVDMIAMSFVRTVDDLKKLRSFIKSRQPKHQPMIIAKIETQEAVDNFTDILAEADGIMVARGDLAVEVPPDRVPLLQKELIKQCNLVGKPVITATQMLESMIQSSVPTRAEVSDVANAILDGTDAVMLSGETAVGLYPVEAVKVMHGVSLRIERHYPEKERLSGSERGQVAVANSVTSSVVGTAHEIGAKLIVALTDSGFTARMVSRHKPESIILTLATDRRVCRRLSLSFGCRPTYVRKLKTINAVFTVVRKLVSANQLAEKGDRVVISAGVPLGDPRVKTNSMFVEVV